MKQEEEEPESALKKDKKRAQEQVSRNSGRKVLAALKKAEVSANRQPPGALLLTQDPIDLNRCASCRPFVMKSSIFWQWEFPSGASIVGLLGCRLQ